MSETFTYSVQNDTLNGKVDEETLLDEIMSNQDIIIGLNNLGVSGDVLTIVFKANLGASEESALTALVASHTGVPITRPEPQVHFVEGIPQGGKRVADRGFSFTATAGQETSYDYLVEEDLFVKDGFLLAKGYKFDDEITMSIVHPVLNVSLHDYIRNSPLYPTLNSEIGRAEATNKAITETNFNGLKVRLTYRSTGLNDVKVKVLMRAYK